MSRSSVQSAEKGTPIDLGTRRAIALTLGVDPQDLLADLANSPDAASVLQVADQPTIAVLIPACGPVPEGLPVQSYVDSILMVPLAGRPIIWWTLSYLQRIGLRRFFIAVPPGATTAEQFVNYAFPDLEVCFVEEAPVGGVGFTVATLAEKASSDADAALVVLGDTYFEFRDVESLRKGAPFVLWDWVEDSGRWCLIERAKNRDLVRAFEEKPQEPRQYEGTQRREALCGVYFFPDLAALRAAAAAATNTERPCEMSHILNRLEAPIQAPRCRLWCDVGNADNYMKAHQQRLEAVGFRERSFNSLKIDAERGTITKSIRPEASRRDTQKLIDEIEYLTLVPRELAVLFPRVLDACTEWPDPAKKRAPRLELEFLAYQNLSDLFVFGQVRHEGWRRIFSSLHSLLSLFRDWELPADRDQIVEMYANKTTSRLEELDRYLRERDRSPDEEMIHGLLRGDLSIGGEELPSPLEFSSKIRKHAERIAADVHQFTIIHGDLCFPNILVDMATGLFRFVDCRGSFGNRRGLYGDPAYDVAKLFQSVRGRYDCIVNDLFRIDAEGSDVNLVIFEPQSPEAPDYYERIVQHFEAVFFPEGGFRRNTISFLTSLLFLSMVPLHSEAPRRQAAMLIRGMQFFDHWIQEPKPLPG